MAVTIRTSARAWREVSSAAMWTALVLWDTGSALYAVVQDTGATPKVRVMKANSRSNPTSWTEQDSANNKAITNVDFPYSSWLAGTTLHVVCFTALNTITHYQFNTSTDLWGTGKGAVTTAAENEHTIRVVARSDGDLLVFFTSSADDADLGYLSHNGTAWGDDPADGVTAILSVNTTAASSIIDAGIDSTDRAWVVYFDSLNTDISYRTINSAGTIAAEVDIDATGPAALSQQPGSRFSLYVDGTTDKIIAAYINSALTIDERIITLESDANATNLATEHAVEGTSTDVGVRTPIATASYNGTLYAAWWDDATSGTLKYSTWTGSAWAAETNFATSITQLIAIAPVGGGLAIVYQTGSDVAMDWIVAPARRARVSWAAVEIPELSGTTASLVVTAAASPAQASASLTGAGLLTGTAATATAAGGAVGLVAASPRRARVSWAAVEIPEASGTANSLVVVAAAATAAGGAVQLSGASPGTLTVAPATAPAAAGTAALTGAAVLSAAGGGVLYGGGTYGAGPYSGSGAASFAEGGAVDLIEVLPIQAVFGVDAALADADGGDVAFVTVAKLTLATATSPAQAGTVALGGQGRIAVAAAAAPAVAGTSSLTAQARLPIVGAGATGAAGAVVLTGGATAAGTLAVAAAAAPAQGNTVTFDAASRLVLAAATASATGGTVVLQSVGVGTDARFARGGLLIRPSYLAALLIGRALTTSGALIERPAATTGGLRARPDARTGALIERPSAVVATLYERPLSAAGTLKER